MKRKIRRPRKVPHFKTDEEAEAFLEQDLSNLDFSQFKPVHFEIRPKEKNVNLRMSEGLYEAVRETAKDEGVPYQRYMRHVLERAVSEHKHKRAKAKAS